jgi:hypothetical protein
VQATTTKQGKLPAQHAAAAKRKQKAKPKAIVYGNASTSVPTAGKTRIVINPTTAAKKLLRKRKQAAVAISLTFTPTGGTPNTKTTSVPVKPKKSKKKR